MFDIGWSEMAIILLIALIVIGPKDLPKVARTMGRWIRKGRALAREFQKQLEDMAREAELDDVKRDIERAGRTDLKRTVEKTVDPEGDLEGAFDTAKGKPRSKGKAAEANGTATANGEDADPAPPAAKAKSKAKRAEPDAKAREKAPAEPG